VLFASFDPPEGWPGDIHALSIANLVCESMAASIAGKTEAEVDFVMASLKAGAENPAFAAIIAGSAGEG
jgi:hypothetical protein